MIRDFLRFLYYNVYHYSLAVWGIRLRFDPPYPILKRFFPAFIAEPVFEYRGYGFHAVLAITGAYLLPFNLLIILGVIWTLETAYRCRYLKTNFLFWQQVYKENGLTCHRATGRWIEQMILEQERCLKQGGDWQKWAAEAFRLQEQVIHQVGSREAARGILAGVESMSCEHVNRR